MPTALAVDYPPPSDGPLDCYPSGPAVTSFGDGLLESCDVPDGWYPEVVTQAAHGSVEFFQGGQTWKFTMATVPAVNTLDSFTYRLTDGQGNFSNTATVRLSMAVEV